MEENNWPLEDIPNPLLSLSSSLTYGSVQESIALQPREANINRNTFLVPGFHFSTTDESADPAEFHRVAAQLLSGAARVDLEGDDEEDEEAEPPQSTQTSRHLHCDLGKDFSGRYCCSCGKSYSTQIRLTEHVQQCAGVENYPCHTCDSVFSSAQSLKRHVRLKHNNDMEPCPECGIKFPVTYLPKHLASGLGGCDSALQSSVLTPFGEDSSARRTLSERYWTIHDEDSRQVRRAHDSACVADEAEDFTQQTRSFVTRLLQRPTSTFDKVFCDLCGEGFWSDGEDLAEHIGQHSLNFSEKRHKCDECRIFFANEKDRDRHLQSANLTQHCGFTFRHNGPCTGHHPPTYTKSSLISDHALMQKHLWSWELSQFRTHRVAVATILAETLHGSADPHMSLADCKRTYASMLPHFAAAHAQSAQPQWSASERESIDDDSLDAHFSRVIDDIDAQQALTAAQVEFNSMSTDRPDSAVILQATRVSLYRHRRSPSKKTSNRSLTTASGEAAERPVSFRPSSIRQSLRGMTLRGPTFDDDATLAEKKIRAHKRQAMNASGFAMLRQQAAQCERPHSAPAHSMRVTAACY